MKNILLIGMNFHGYEDDIIMCLLKQGNNVFYYADANLFMFDFLNRHFSKLKRRRIVYHQKDIINQLKQTRIDYIIVLVGRYLQPEFLEKLHELNPDARFVLYLWDDVKRIQNFESVRSFYDDIYSFDPQDSSCYNFKFLPLFYNELHMNPTDFYQDDIFSAMVNHSDREKVVHKIINRYSKLKANIILTCGLPKLIKMKLAFDGSKKNGIHYSWQEIKSHEVTNSMLQSRAVLDVQFPSQVGLTIRTMDTLSVGRKLITTNHSVQYYDFYDPQNICIIDRENPLIPTDFFMTPYKPVPLEILEKYSLYNWLNVLFGKKKDSFLITNNPYGL